MIIFLSDKNFVNLARVPKIAFVRLNGILIALSFPPSDIKYSSSYNSLLKNGKPEESEGDEKIY